MARSRRVAGENDRSAWQNAIVFWFERPAKKGQIRMRPELRVQAAPLHFLVPDVTLLDRRQPVERVVTLTLPSPSSGCFFPPTR
jgi:hypothetical protein